MKLSILKSLLALGVTKEDAQKYIVLLEKREEKRTSKKIETLVPIAYLKEDGSLECLPYLDTSRKSEIFGIKVAGCVWKKETSGKDVTFYEATKMAEKEGCMLPSASDFEALISSHCDWIDSVMMTTSTLKEHGVNVCLPGGKTSFWTRERTEDRENITVYNMYNQVNYKYDPTKRTAHAHFVRYI